MNDNFYKQLIKESPTGYAYHRIICEEEGIPCDYEFIEVNSAFEALTGLRGSDIVGRRVTEILPDIRKSKFDWIHFYGDIAINGGKKEFEQYSEPLNKWYKVNVYSPEKNYFITHFVDITKEMSRLSAVKSMVALSEEFLQINEQEIDYQKINDDLLNITGAKYAMFNLFDEVGKSSTTMAISGDKGIIKKATEIIGYKFEGNKWEQDLEREEKIKTGTITRFPSLKELVGRAIPKPIVGVLLEKTLNLGEVILIKILKNNIRIGSFILIMEKGEQFDEDALAELYTRQVGIVITRKNAEEALRSNRRQLTDIIEFLPDATLAIDKERRVIIWNKAIEEMTCIPAAEMIGKGDYAYTIPFYGEAQPQLMDLVFLDDEEITTRYPNLTRVGDALMAEVFCPAIYNNKGAWVLAKASPLHDQSGNIIGAIESIHDITKRKQAEDALKESEEKYRLLITKMQQGLAVNEVILDEAGKVVDYRFLDVNESFERLTGLKHENIIGKTVLEILPGTESYWIEKFGHVAMTGEPLQYENYSKEQDKYFEVVAYSPQYKQFAIIISDITERKRLEITLVQEKNLLETTLISVGDGVISTDNKGTIVFLNRVAEFLTGWTQEAAMEKSIEEVFNIVNEFTREKCENIVKKVLESGKILELANHTILISKDGIERPIEDSAAPIVQENGEIVGVVLVFRDFSEKKQKLKEIEFLSYHDQLTGLYNRRFYEAELKRLDTERNLPMTIVMGDVNGLKIINDSFGHAMGDELLKKVAELIKKGCRADDIIARLGGDEFVIIFPKTNAFEAEDVIKRVQDLVLKEKAGSIIISISFGYETKNNEEENIQEIFKIAEDRMYRHKLSESSSIRGKTIDLIMNTLYEKNNREKLHSKRVSEICEDIATKMNFDKDDVNQIRIAGLMHDIGKIAIEENILNKPGKLTEDEWNEIKRHSEIGYRILSSVNKFSEIAEYVLEHQEKWDGKGYPRGLKGEEISLQARVIVIADAFDAMTTNRTYCKALSEEEATNEIRRCSGTQFDPTIARVFIEKVLGKEWE